MPGSRGCGAKPQPPLHPGPTKQFPDGLDQRRRVGLVHISGRAGLESLPVMPLEGVGRVDHCQAHTHPPRRHGGG